jgi:DNA-binding winged helix-turn-helix (wHTH) protein
MWLKTNTLDPIRASDEGSWYQTFVPVEAWNYSKFIWGDTSSEASEPGRQMKCFQAFRLDTANQCLWRGQERVPIPPKPYDMLRYLVENPGRLITQDELLEKLWPEIYVNPELIRKYILDIRKILGDRPDKPEFIETVTKRGYRFIASVVDEDATSSTKPAAIEEGVATETIRSKPEGAFRKRGRWKLALIPVLAVVIAAAISRESRVARNERTVASSNDPSIAVLPFADMSPGKDQEYF